MSEYGTIKIPSDDYERHNERRKDLGLTWAAYIDGQAPEIPNGGEVPTDELVASVRDELDSLAFQGALTDEEADRILSSLQTVEERTGRIEQTLEGLQR